MENAKLIDYITRSTQDIKEFHSFLPEKSFFYGTGGLLQNDKNCKYTMLVLNENVYLIKEISFEDKFIFDTIHELKKSFLKTDFFIKGRQYGQFSYLDFETDLEVEIKIYEYHNEKRLIINPLNKIDLLYSIHFHQENELTQFEIKKYPSIENVLKMDKMMKKLNSRLNTVTQNGSFT